MLYLIGLGLGDVKDITVKGVEVIRRCSRVYLESYTSVLPGGLEALERFHGRPLIPADRETVEQRADEILRGADTTDVALLVAGDPLGATTHGDLVLRAARAGVPHRVLHNASILTAVGCCGLQLYAFGGTASVPFWTDGWRPESFYGHIARNRAAGLHTLCLLDIQVKEQSAEDMMAERKVFQPPRFMSVAQAARQLLEIVASRRRGEEGEEPTRGKGEEPGGGEGEEPALSEDTVCVGLARVGADDQRVVTATLKQLASCDLGAPLHSLIVTGRLHPLEVDMLRLSAVPDALIGLRMADSSTYTS